MTVIDTQITTVGQLKGALALCKKVMVWTNMFVHDGAYVQVPKKEIARVSLRELDDTPVRGRLDNESGTLYLS